MTQTVAQIRSALRKALSKLGTTNSHALPSGGNNHDAVLHELYVASEIEAYGKKRREEALKAVRNHVIEVNNGVDEIERVDPGTEQALIHGVHYSLTVKRSNPSSRLDKTVLQNKLQTDLELDLGAALHFINDCSKTNKAATTIRAIGSQS